MSREQPITTGPGPWGAPRDDGLDPRWGQPFQYLINTYPEAELEIWALMRECFDYGAREQGDDPQLLPPNPFLVPQPRES